MADINFGNRLNILRNRRLRQAAQRPPGETPSPRRGAEDNRFFLETDLEIVELELLGTLFSITSSMYYFQAGLIGREIVLSELNGITSNLDATPLVDIGETLLRIALFTFAIASFMRAEERKIDKALYPDTAQDPEPFERIAISYIPTILANEIRIDARQDILSNLPNI